MSCSLFVREALCPLMKVHLHAWMQQDIFTLLPIRCIALLLPAVNPSSSGFCPMLVPYESNQRTAISAVMYVQLIWSDLVSYFFSRGDDEEEHITSVHFILYFRALCWACRCIPTLESYTRGALHVCLVFAVMHAWTNASIMRTCTRRNQPDKKMHCMHIKVKGSLYAEIFWFY